jgi:threonine aldolase
MGNLVAVLVHCNKRGAEAIVGDNAHMFLYEQGSMAQFGGVQANIIPNEPDGTYSIEKVIENIRPDDIHNTRTSLICVENTHNRCGGRALPQKWLDELTQLAHNNGIPVHMDGARLFNASVATGIPAARIVRDCDSVSICLSKGLGAPVGSVLVGTERFIAEARRMKKALGGGMRQAGIIAAAGLYCMDHMIDRLGEDHENAKIVAKAIHDLKSPVVSVDLDLVESNIIFLLLNGVGADDVCERFAKIDKDEEKKLGRSIKVLSAPKSDKSIRLVLHYDVSREMAIKAAEKICYVIQEFSTKVQPDHNYSVNSFQEFKKSKCHNTN